MASFKSLLNDIQLNINYGAEHWQLEPAAIRNCSVVELITDDHNSKNHLDTNHQDNQIDNNQLNLFDQQIELKSTETNLIKFELESADSIMSNKYAPLRTQHSSSKSNTFCEVCSEQLNETATDNRSLLICTLCGTRSHLNCEQLTNDEYQIFSNLSKHPNIYWKCVHCTWPTSNRQQLTNLENLIELMYSQLKELHSKVDFLMKNQQSISSIIHQYHNQGRLFNQNQATNCISPNQHNQFNFNKHHELYSANANTNFNNNSNCNTRWNNRYLPHAPASNLNNLPINHLESITSPFYSTNLENDELINEDIKFRNLGK